MSVLSPMDAEAERWFTRLRAGDCTAEERRAFERWRQERAEHVQAFAAVESAWVSLDELSDDPEINAWRNEARAATSPAREVPRRRHWAYGLVASVLVAAVCVAWIWTPTTYRTARGEQRIVQLQEGSRLILNTDTHIKVSLAGSSRRIRLVTGEAMFEVAPDATRPFEVQVRESTVTATGTRFSVLHLANRTEVTLLEGGVKVSEGARTERLKPHEQLRLSVQRWDKTIVDPVQAASWTHGKLIFSDTPLPEVLASVNRYGPGRIDIGDATLRTFKVSGTFNIGQPPILIRALESAFPIQAETDGRTQTTVLYHR